VTHLAYLAALVVSLGGLAFVDAWYRLAFFSQPRRTFKTLALAYTVFFAWDISGIGAGIFLAGDSRYATGVRVLPQLPLEELFFLALLVYTPLILYRFWEVKWPRT